jgi:hypothetical protein
MNKLAFTILLIVPLLSGGILQGQISYDALENRFLKQNLSAQDSAAFKKQGLQKAQSLFYKTDLYWSNSGNRSNQAYIAQSLPDMFYVVEDDSLDLAPLMAAIDQIQNRKNYQEPQFKLIQIPGYLAQVQTINTKPQLSFLLVLKQAPKKFGNSSEVVWQVFLAKPEID